MPQRFAPERIAGLHRERVQRPEIFLDHSKQGTPAEPGNRKGNKNDQDESRSRGLCKTDPGFSDPGGQHDRSQAEQHRGQQDREHPGEHEFGQADFGKKTAEDREKRALPRGGLVVLHVAASGIDNPISGAREGRSIVFGGRVVHWARPPCFRRLSRGVVCSVAIPWLRTCTAICGLRGLRLGFVARARGKICRSSELGSDRAGQCKLDGATGRASPRNASPELRASSRGLADPRSCGAEREQT